MTELLPRRLQHRHGFERRYRRDECKLLYLCSRVTL